MNLNPFSALTGSDYRDAALRLLPRGRAWPRGLMTILGRFFGGVGNFLWSFHAAASNLEDVELSPLTTVALIDLWEGEYGLPDPCVAAVQTLERRREAVVARKIDPGGMSRQRYIDLAAQFGVTATIDEWINQFTGLPDPTANFVWRLNTNEPTDAVPLTVGGLAGDRIESWGDSALECAITERNRAGRIVLFGYL